VRADFLLRNISTLVTCAGPAPRSGARQAEASPVHDAAVAARDGRIVFAGRETALSKEVDLDQTATVIDVEGGSVVPGFVDAHTHVVYAGNRREELARRLVGETYEQIAAADGGILSTVAATRAADEQLLIGETRGRLDEMLRCGTTTCEAKSGYGLTTESEIRMLRVIAALSRSHAIELAPTFLGAHEVPPEYAGHSGAYVRLVVEEMIPRVAGERLAESCDVFCEANVFTPDESRRVLVAAREAGLELRVHADQLSASGGSKLAAELRVRSADHLTFVDAEGARLLATAGVVATLLPSAAFYLKLSRRAPARLLVDSGVPVALGTDVNPGGGLSPSMTFAMTLACFDLGLTFEEALVAATLNAAYALDRHDRVGSLEVGKQLDAVVVDSSPLDLLRIGADAVRAVIKKGSLVYARR